MILSMFISRRWHSWDGIGSGIWPATTTDEERLYYESKTCPESRKSFPVLVQKLPCYRAKVPCSVKIRFPVFVPGAAVARPPRPISAGGPRRGGALSAPPPLRIHAAVKIVGEGHILCYVCSRPIRLTHSPSRCSVIPVAGIKLGIGRRLCVASDAEQRTEGVERVEAPVEPKREFVEVGL